MEALEFSRNALNVRATPAPPTAASLQSVQAGARSHKPALHGTARARACHLPKVQGTRKECQPLIQVRLRFHVAKWNMSCAWYAHQDVAHTRLVRLLGKLACI